MKLNRLMMGSLLCLSLSAPSAFACDGGSGKGDSGGWSFISFFQHLCDHDHDNDNKGGNDRDHNNGGHQCSHGGSSGSGGSSSTGGGKGDDGSGSTQYK